MEIEIQYPDEAVELRYKEATVFSNMMEDGSEILTIHCLPAKLSAVVKVENPNQREASLENVYLLYKALERQSLVN